MFFTASEENIRDFLKYTKKRARKLRKRMGKNLFLHAMSAAKLRTRQTSSLLECFSQRVQKIFEIFLKYTKILEELK